MDLRPGGEDDLPALTELYNHYVTSSLATFDDVPFTIDQRREWLHHYDTTGPHRLVVAVEDDRLLGYATSSPFRPKPGYRTTVEISVYVDAAATGRGVGQRLYTRLFEELDGQPLHRALAGIAVPNPESVRLHERFGFSHIGTYTEVGTKLGEWVDVAWYERPL
ncbi:N-acetyltransferase family protein [Lapillicoccus sp.]|uniref:GNAT family N-acetyltransferase n=1 Tax=Lapillicoccus sp. TaxID=1909287 RepID=UPI0027C140A0|nr:N-acetyltransferase family protein [Actinomycetota bacterium]